MVRASLILSCNLLLFISELTRIVIQIDDALKVRKYRYAWFSENGGALESQTGMTQANFVGNIEPGQPLSILAAIVASEQGKRETRLTRHFLPPRDHCSPDYLFPIKFVHFFNPKFGEDLLQHLPVVPMAVHNPAVQHGPRHEFSVPVRRLAEAHRLSSTRSIV